MYENIHFSVDGTLIEAWASHKSFKPKQAKTDDDGSNFHGQLHKNDTHQSTTDPEAKLYRKADGREAKLSYLGHALMENSSERLDNCAGISRCATYVGLGLHCCGSVHISDDRNSRMRRAIV